MLTLPQTSLLLLVCTLKASGLVTRSSTRHSLHPPSLQKNVAEPILSSTALASSSDSESETDQSNNSLSNSISEVLLNFRKAAAEGFGTRAKNVAATCSVGDVVVPLCGNIEKRQLLANMGVYPGVEYIICDLSDTATGESSSAKERIATIRPAYPLREHLERSDWPVSIALDEVPLWLSKTTYEAGTALGTLMLSGSFLTTAAIIASILRLAVIPSESMIPALMPGDVRVLLIDHCELLTFLLY